MVGIQNNFYYNTVLTLIEIGLKVIIKLVVIYKARGRNNFIFLISVSVWTNLSHTSTNFTRQLTDFFCLNWYTIRYVIVVFLFLFLVQLDKPTLGINHQRNYKTAHIILGNSSYGVALRKLY